MGEIVEDHPLFYRSPIALALKQKLENDWLMDEERQLFALFRAGDNQAELKRIWEEYDAAKTALLDIFNARIKEILADEIEPPNT